MPLDLRLSRLGHRCILAAHWIKRYSLGKTKQEGGINFQQYLSAIEPKDCIMGASVGVTLLLGIWNFIANYRSSRRTAFINTVTSQRIKWIEQLRQDVSTFSGLTHTWCFSALEGKPQEYEVLKEIDRLRHVIRLRLNPAGEHDKKIETLIGDIPNLTSEPQRDRLVKALEELTRTTQLLLKEEWEKVKAESKSGDVSEKVSGDVGEKKMMK